MNIIEEANDAYYNKDEPIISDKEFDLLSDDGLDTRSFHNKTNHYIPMGSLNKIKTENDFKKWGRGNNIAVTPKLDGNSIELVVNSNGDIIQGITRGNGCLDENSNIELDSGEIITIRNIVENNIQCKIKSFNHQTGQIEYKNIKNWFINGNDEEWFEIELENSTRLVLTGNHQVWLKNKNKYVSVKDVVENDEVEFIENLSILL